MHCGDNGILKGAEYATDKYQNKAEQEQNELAKIDDYIQNGREENSFIGTELLKEKIIVQTSTAVKTMSLEFELKESIKNYKYIVISYGGYNNSTQKIFGKSSLFFPVNEVLDESELYLNSAAGPFYSYIGVRFKENAVTVVESQSANTSRTHFAITSIKGIK